jgi:hypothetical protein
MNTWMFQSPSRGGEHTATLTVIGFEAGKLGPRSVFKLRDAVGIETTAKVLGRATLAEVTANPRAFIGREAVIAYRAKTPDGAYQDVIFDHWASPGGRKTTNAPMRPKVDWRAAGLKAAETRRRNLALRASAQASA